LLRFTGDPQGFHRKLSFVKDFKLTNDGGMELLVDNASRCILEISGWQTITALRYLR
jgi:hypothetical protein